MTDQTVFMAEPPVAAVRRRGPGPAVLTALLALIAGLALGGYAAWRWGDRLGLQRATPTVVTASAQPAAPVLDLPTLTGRESMLAAQLAALEARTMQVGQMAGTAGGYATRAEDLLVAQAARRKIERGQPLGYLEQQLRSRFGGTQPRAVETLVHASGDPVTLEDLRLGLETVGPELAYGGNGSGLFGAIKYQLANLIVLHRTATPSPSPTERLERMRRAVVRGQVDAALAEANSLPGAASENRWMVAARRYVAVQRALDTIESAALASPSAPTSPPNPIPVQPPAPVPDTAAVSPAAPEEQAGR